MKKNQKIGIIVAVSVILGSLFLITFLINHSFSLQSENKPSISNLKINYDDLSSLNPIIIGAHDAPTTIIFFNDYQCQECKTWYMNEYKKIAERLIESKKTNMIFVDSLSLENNSQIEY